MTDCSVYFKSLVEQDNTAIVICDLNHTIIYMNPASVLNYKKYGGTALLGKSLLACHNENSAVMIKKVVQWFSESVNNNCVHTAYNEKQNKDIYMIALRDDAKNLIGYYEKHEYRNKDTSPFYEI
ncbi:PAS domain-containing protein [uncultured Treponema sp.]|uniref:PAS domain-containing protein n=1 Tax=uncultured Treponema sp. TaxID=162155 RepID=UPI002598C087|nr:PAS domain-containing protein [uncultured Treponema sp.]